MNVAWGVLPVARGTPAWRGQHAHLLVVANGLCRYTGGVGELANG